MLQKLTLQIDKKSKKSNKIEIDFIIQNNLIYHVEDAEKRLCISLICEKIVFEIAHNQNNYANFH